MPFLPRHGPAGAVVVCALALTSLTGCPHQSYIHWIDAGFDAGPDAGVCTWFAPCVPDNPCHAGHAACMDGGTVCLDEGTVLSDGTSCADAGICYEGSCGACGSSCVPGDAQCTEGVITCTGPDVCVATSRPLPDLTPCQGAQICVDGTCQPCTNLGPCAPMNTCHQGYLSCGPAACHDTGQTGPDGHACGTSGVCHTGACAPTPYALTIVSGDQQQAYADQSLPDAGVVLLTDSTGTALPSVSLSVMPPAGGTAASLAVTTASDGTAGFDLRLGRPLGPAPFQVTGPGGAQVTVTGVSVAPADGMIFGVVNDEEVGGNSGLGPATTHQIEGPGGVAVAPDGTLYYSDMYNCRVEAVSPAGEVSEIVGTAAMYNCGFNTESGAAANVKLQTPSFLALDATGTVLFVSDTGNNRIRRVDLTAGTLATYAGGGTAAVAPFGDGLMATDATLSQPAWIGWGPLSPAGGGGTALYIADVMHGTLRYVDSQQVIHTMTLPSSGGDCTSVAVAVQTCDFGCTALWSPSGDLYLSAQFCGTQFGSSTPNVSTPGVAMLASSGTWSAVAGSLSGTTAEGIAATSASFYETPLIVLDPAGDLFLDIRYEQRLRRIDATTGLITTIAGTTTEGSIGSYVPATLALLNAPDAIALDTQLNLYVADSGNDAVRVIWHAGSL